MLDFNQLSLDQLADALLTDAAVYPVFDLAVREDLDDVGDITSTSIIDAERMDTGVLAARQNGIVAGMAVVQRYLAHRGLEASLSVLMGDGQRCRAGDVLAEIRCPLLALLAIERPVLNFLGRLSGIATLTGAYVKAVAGTKATICDTRKTIPALRALEKYAVACGGATLHRIGLFDAALYKDNHLAHIPNDELAARLAEAARRVRASREVRFVEVEVDSLEQFAEVLEIEPGLIDIVLLDNMQPEMLRQAVDHRNSRHSRIMLEASGGVDLSTVRVIAESGVERIAVGAVTHGAPWLDIGLDLSAEQVG